MDHLSNVNIDPTTLAVLRDAFVSIVHDMSNLLCRTSQSYVTAVIRDHHTSIYDATGRLVSSSFTIPASAGAGRYQARLVAEKYKGRIYPGDEFIMNCTYTAYGTHLPDWTFIRPIFYKDELVFLAFSKAHQLDTSGAWPGGYFPRAYDIHAEGLMIPCIKWTEKGEPMTYVRELIMNNVRYRDQQRLDVEALFASLKLCEERLTKLLDKYGRDVVMGGSDQLIDVMRRTVKNQIAQIPDGTYYAEAACDEDGTHPNKPVWVRCDMTIKGDAVTFDFSKSDPQTDFVSVPLCSTHARVGAALFTVMDPSLAYHHNEGSYEAYELIAPEGSVVNPTYPTTVGACPVNVGLQIVETVIDALGKAKPENATAGWGRQIAFTEFGKDRSNRRYFSVQMNAHGGAGAIWGYDGWPHLGMFTGFGTFRKGTVELIETRYPWRMLCYELLKDSSGDGRWRGGNGVRVEWLSDNDEGREHTIITGDADGLFTDIYGVAGGQSPPRNRMFLHIKGEEPIPLLSKRGPFTLKRGDMVMQYASGGSGVGDPIEREVDLVRRDVFYDYVSIEKARDVYKVVIDPVTLKVNEEETKRLRAEAMAARKT